MVKQRESGINKTYTMRRIILGLTPLVFINFLKNKIRYKFNFIQNINWDPTAKEQPRVLISYITDPLINKGNKIRSTRGIECALIIKEFINNGYCVDVIDSRDIKNILMLRSKKYQILFGFGDVFYQLSKNNICKKRILYLTEKHPSYSNKKENERIEYLKKRHGKRVVQTRTNLHYKEDHFNFVDAIVFIGNENEEKLIPICKPKFSIRPTGLYNSAYIPQKRNLSISKKNFLWFGSLGAVHKGLDLLIDVFNDQEECTLYIGGLGVIDKKILPKVKNKNKIIDLGYVNVHSESFLELVYKCSFIIFPSCSEGISTSVITCMNHGLIPIITKETGIILKDIGIELKDFKIETIAKIVREVSKRENEWFLEQHSLVYKNAHKNYSKENFHSTFTTICDNIINKI
jgi:Glycosyltransferase